MKSYYLSAKGGITAVSYLSRKAQAVYNAVGNLRVYKIDNGSNAYLIRDGYKETYCDSLTELEQYLEGIYELFEGR